MDPEYNLREELAKRVAASIDQACRAFVIKFEGELPAESEIINHAHFIQIDGDPAAKFFIWKKHNVLAIRLGSMDQPAAVVFCHLFPDDWPEPVANFIAGLP